jgi:nitroimidazol reductase NimA-like FMN-containing flavoprotein (pyridoxamine 5'-phosphate oxidase superfamily)
VEALAFIADRPIGVIATVDEDGTPHVVPIEVLVRDGKVYSWCEADSVKAKNAKRTGRAAIMAYKGVAGALVRGRARMLTEADPSYAAIARGFLDKYAREETYGNDTLIEVTPERVAIWEH